MFCAFDFHLRYTFGTQMAWEQFVLNHGSIREETVKRFLQTLFTSCSYVYLMCLFIHSFNTNFLKGYYVPGIVLSAGDIVLRNKKKKKKNAVF